jgi:hypothetical protein
MQIAAVVSLAVLHAPFNQADPVGNRKRKPLPLPELTDCHIA